MYYNTVRSSLYYEILNLESKLLQTKVGPNADFFFKLQ